MINRALFFQTKQNIQRKGGKEEKDAPFFALVL